jgi:hypothetical protein
MCEKENGSLANGFDSDVKECGQLRELFREVPNPTAQWWTGPCETFEFIFKK